MHLISVWGLYYRFRESEISSSGGVRSAPVTVRSASMSVWDQLQWVCEISSSDCVRSAPVTVWDRLQWQHAISRPQWNHDPRQFTVCQYQFYLFGIAVALAGTHGNLGLEWAFLWVYISRTQLTSSWWDRMVSSSSQWLQQTTAVCQWVMFCSFVWSIDYSVGLFQSLILPFHVFLFLTQKSIESCRL